MRFILAASLFFMIAACSRNQIEYIPLRLEWYAYEGLTFIENETPLSIDSAMETWVNDCVVSMTRELFHHFSQKNSSSGIDFKVQYYVYQSSADSLLRFLGQSNLSDSISWNRTPIISAENSPENYFWTANCSKKGKVKNLEFKGSF